MKISLTILITCLFLGVFTVPSQAEESAYRELVDKRMRQANEWIAVSPEPSVTPPTLHNTSMLLRHVHASWLSGKNVDPAKLNQAVLAVCAVCIADPVMNPAPAKALPKHGVRPDPLLMRLYLKPQYREVLTPESRKAIEDLCWSRVYRWSTLSDAPGTSPYKPIDSVWAQYGSENHDLRERTTNLLALEVLMKAGAPYGPDAKLLDGFTVAEHHRKWELWFCGFFPERIREGLVQETSHPSSYGEATIGCYYAIEDLASSPELKQAATDFLNVFWAKEACEFEPRTGIRASVASVRCKKGTQRHTGIFWAKELLFAYGWTDVEARPRLVSANFFIGDYRPPEILKVIASDKNRGPYLGSARCFGDTMAFIDSEDRNSHIRRDVWYTTDYCLAALSVDPGQDAPRVTQSIVMGVTFSNDVNDRIVIYGANSPATRESESGVMNWAAVNGMVRPDCFIAARDPNANKTPFKKEMSNCTRVFVSKGSLADNLTKDESGWFFTHAGDGYAAIRAAGESPLVATLSPLNNGQLLESADIWAPVVIQTGQAGKFESFDAFKAVVKALPFTYTEGKLSYTALNGESYEVHSNSKALPTINGKPLDLNPPLAYDYPYLSMIHGSNKAVIKYPGHNDVVIAF